MTKRIDFDVFEMNFTHGEIFMLLRSIWICLLFFSFPAFAAQFAYVVNTFGSFISVVETITGFNSPQAIVISLVAAVQSPINGHLIQKAEKFLTQAGYRNAFTWSPPSSGLAPVFYIVFANASLTKMLGTVSKRVLTNCELLGEKNSNLFTPNF